MLDNLSIGKKMILLSGTILILLLATLIWGIYGLSKTVENGQEVADGNQLHAELLQREIDHLNWAEKISAFLSDQKTTTLDVQTDHTRCSFGKWYYGEGRKQVEAMHPELRGVLQEIEKPHLQLHASAKKIKQLFQPPNERNSAAEIMQGKMQAQKIFTNETRVRLSEVQEKLHEMIQIAAKNIMSDKQMLSEAVSTRTGITVIGIIALLIGSLISFFISRSLTTPLRSTVSMLTELSHGHIDQRLKLKRSDEIGQMADAMDSFADSLQLDIVKPLQQIAEGDLRFKVSPYDDQDLLRNAIQKVGTDLNDIIEQIQNTGKQINAASGQVADSSQSLSQGATETAASLEEISSSMSEMTSQISLNAENASQANQLATDASKAAESGNQQMKEMINAMAEIDEAGQKISKIIKVIDEIAFQTNLLALNAAVEAARAGQHGKGFAVVAEEVRNLAARSAKAAAETSELIEGSVEKTRNGNLIAEQTSTALGGIVGSITKVTDLVAEIAAASSEQAQGISQINIGLGQIDQTVQQSTATAEESAAAAEELASQAEHMKHMLSRFALAGDQNIQFTAPQLSAPAATATPTVIPAASGWGESPAVKPLAHIQLDDDEFGKF